MATRDECGDHGYLLGDVGDGAWLDLRRKKFESLAVGMEFIRPALGELGEGFPRGLCATDRLIIDVCDIAHMSHMDAGYF